MPDHGPSTVSTEPVTRILADYVAAASPGQLPENVRKEATRTFLNWLGCAIGGCRHEAVEAALAALLPFSGPGTASILGRGERLDPLQASLINGISSHVFDFDDTHLRTVIHPAGPLASALLAYAQHVPVSGPDFINALVLGAEVSCRVGNAVFPEHYDVGWHITGSTGSLGAAAAIGKLLGLDAQQMGWALGIAASQPVGLREQFGSMTKSFHPGRAAQNGLTAALMAAKGYTASEQALEAKRGWLNVLSTRHDTREITDGLGQRYEILANSYKPFACGIVLHPSIDACIQLHNQGGFRIAEIQDVTLRVHPLVLELTGKTKPRDGLEGKFSVYHAAAVALIEGDGGEHQFSDRAVTDPNIIALRQKVTATIDPGMAPDAAHLTVSLTDGRKLECDVPHAIGSLARPMTDQDLERKFTGLAAEHLKPGAIEHLLSLCWQIEALDDVSKIAEATHP
jgi:2-methylcitrate dehydratase PrpD